jgi:hypothetical protein
MPRLPASGVSLTIQAERNQLKRALPELCPGKVFGERCFTSVFDIQSEATNGTKAWTLIAGNAMSGFEIRKYRAPMGCLDLRRALDSVWRRMFNSIVSPEVIAAAEANVFNARNQTPGIDYLPPKIPERRKPIEFLVDALKSDRLNLYIYDNISRDIVRVPAQYAEILIERTGFLRTTRKNVTYGFIDSYPTSLLEDLEIPGVRKLGFDRFALCVKERPFFAWLADTADRLQWPMDAKRRQGPGRPALVDSSMPILRDIVELGWWRQGTPLTRLVAFAKLRIKGGEIDRETVKKALDKLYEKTGLPAYHYVRRPRRASVKPRKRGS